MNTTTAKKAQFTAGEWTKHENKDGSFDVCGQHGKRSESDVIAYKVLPHNARLIASAPSLLSALERILTKTFRDEHDPDVYRLAIEAIAKAKGE